MISYVRELNYSLNSEQVERHTMVDQLSLKKKLSYGVGHVLNDLTASMWFSYLLIYLHRVIQFGDALSGYMMFLGESDLWFIFNLSLT